MARRESFTSLPSLATINSSSVVGSMVSSASSTVVGSMVSTNSSSNHSPISAAERYYYSHPAFGYNNNNNNTIPSIHGNNNEYCYAGQSVDVLEPSAHVLFYQHQQKGQRWSGGSSDDSNNNNGSSGGGPMMTMAPRRRLSGSRFEVNDDSMIDMAPGIAHPRRRSSLLVESLSLETSQAAREAVVATTTTSTMNSVGCVPRRRSSSVMMMIIPMEPLDEGEDADSSSSPPISHLPQRSLAMKPVLSRTVSSGDDAPMPARRRISDEILVPTDDNNNNNSNNTNMEVSGNDSIPAPAMRRISAQVMPNVSSNNKNHASTVLVMPQRKISSLDDFDYHTSSSTEHNNNTSNNNKRPARGVMGSKKAIPPRL